MLTPLQITARVSRRIGRAILFANAFVAMFVVFSVARAAEKGSGNAAPQTTEVPDSAFERPPVPRVQVPPVYPPALKQAKIGGNVSISFLVTEAGEVTEARVTKSSRPEFEAPALEAIKQWQFDPAMKHGRPVEIRVELPMIFNPSAPEARASVASPGSANAAAVDEKPVLRVSVPPTYPFAMRRAGITGQVVVDFVVNASGDVVNAYAIRSTNREFEAPAVMAVSKWKYRPAIKDGHPVSWHMQLPVIFNLGG